MVWNHSYYLLLTGSGSGLYILQKDISFGPDNKPGIISPILELKKWIWGG